MTLTIAPVQLADHESIKAYVDVSESVRAHDGPEWVFAVNEAMLSRMMKFPFTGRRNELYVGYWDGVPAARLELNFPTEDNLTKMFFQLEVVPELRRKGIGKQMLDFAIEQAKANGRDRMATGASLALPGIPAPDESGNAFAEALGFSNTLPEVMRRLKLADVDDAHLDDMLSQAWAKADGYRVVQWSNFAPEEYVDDVAYLDGRLMTDAPMGDLDIEPPDYTAERARKDERTQVDRGRTTYHTGAVHIESDTLVAWTTISKDAEVGRQAWQMITIVDPKHRGHRLGAIVKVENLRYFRGQQPDVELVDTFNAHENSYMISINEDMGFRALYAYQNWQREV